MFGFIVFVWVAVLIRTSVLVDSVFAEVLDRGSGAGEVRVRVSLLESRFSGRRFSARFRLVKESGSSRVSLSGVVSAEADSDEEAEALRRAVESGENGFLAGVIMVRTLPVILHIEESMGVPPIPVLPEASCMGRKSMDSDGSERLIYQ